MEEELEEASDTYSNRVQSSQDGQVNMPDLEDIYTLEMPSISTDIGDFSPSLAMATLQVETQDTAYHSTSVYEQDPFDTSLCMLPTGQFVMVGENTMWQWFEGEMEHGTVGRPEQNLLQMGQSGSAYNSAEVVMPMECESLGFGAESVSEKTFCSRQPVDVVGVKSGTSVQVTWPISAAASTSIRADNPFRQQSTEGAEAMAAATTATTTSGQHRQEPERQQQQKSQKEKKSLKALPSPKASSISPGIEKKKGKKKQDARKKKHQEIVQLAARAFQAGLTKTAGKDEKTERSKKEKISTIQELGRAVQSGDKHAQIRRVVSESDGQPLQNDTKSWKSMLSRLDRSINSQTDGGAQQQQTSAMDLPVTPARAHYQRDVETAARDSGSLWRSVSDGQIRSTLGRQQRDVHQSGAIDATIVNSPMQTQGAGNAFEIRYFPRTLQMESGSATHANKQMLSGEASSATAISPLFDSRLCTNAHPINSSATHAFISPSSTTTTAPQAVFPQHRIHICVNVAKVCEMQLRSLLKDTDQVIAAARSSSALSFQREIIAAQTPSRSRSQPTESTDERLQHCLRQLHTFVVQNYLVRRAGDAPSHGPSHTTNATSPTILDDLFQPSCGGSVYITQFWHWLHQSLPQQQDLRDQMCRVEQLFLQQTYFQKLLQSTHESFVRNDALNVIDTTTWQIFSYDQRKQLAQLVMQLRTILWKCTPSDLAQDNPLFQDWLHVVAQGWYLADTLSLLRIATSRSSVQLAAVS